MRPAVRREHSLALSLAFRSLDTSQTRAPFPARTLSLSGSLCPMVTYALPTTPSPCSSLCPSHMHRARATLTKEKARTSARHAQVIRNGSHSWPTDSLAARDRLTFTPSPVADRDRRRPAGLIMIYAQRDGIYERQRLHGVLEQRALGDRPGDHLAALDRPRRSSAESLSELAITTLRTKKQSKSARRCCPVPAAAASRQHGQRTERGASCSCLVLLLNLHRALVFT